MAIELVENWTAAIEYQLLACGAAQDLTGATVTISAWQPANVAKAFNGSVVVTSATGGKVEFRPCSTDIVALDGNIEVRFKVVASSKTSYFPNAETEKWVIHRA